MGATKTLIRWERSSVFVALALLLTVLPFPPRQPAGATETVPPSFSKVFDLDTIGPGSTSTLTFTIDNSDNPGYFAEELAFTDVLPVEITIADPAGATNTCGGTATAPDGGGTITLTDGGVGGGDTCTISVNVTSDDITVEGGHLNSSGDLTSTLGNSGGAEDELFVDDSLPGFSKSFSPASIPLGGTSTLTFTIDNDANGSAASFVSFSDPLPAGMIIATPAAASHDCTSGAVTAISGTNTIVFFGGFLFAEDSCEVTVDVTTTSNGTFVNVTDDLTTSFPVDAPSGFATAALEVPLQDLDKVFVDDPVAPGGTVELEFTINNLSRTEALTNIEFTDVLSDALASLSATPPPTPDPPCGEGSSLTGTTTLTFTGGSLPAEGSCTFSVPVTVPGAAAPGDYVNTSSILTGDLGGVTFFGNAATDVLSLSAAPTLTKEFTDDPVAPGDTVTLHFELTDNTAAGGSSDIAFVDDLTAYLPFPVSIASGLGAVCNGGTLSVIPLGSEMEGLSLTGGSLASGTSCGFDVEIDIPAGFPGGLYVNVAGDLTATVGGETVFGLPAMDVLDVVFAPTLRKEFLTESVLPGDPVTVEFTLNHDELAAEDAVGIGFTDDLAAMASGVTASLPSIPDPPCGVGSSLVGSVGDTFLTFAGATLAPGEECTFAVDLAIDSSADLGTHTNTTSDVTATVDGTAVTGIAAEDALTISPISITKTFTDDPVLPGDTVTLEFTITLDSSSPTDATSIVFRDDLAATLAGLKTTAPVADTEVCDPDGAGGDPGTGTLLSSSSDTFLSFLGGTLAAGESCTFSVSLAVPSAALAGSYKNVTELDPEDFGGISGFIDGAFVIGAPGTDELVVELPLPPLLTKEFTTDPVAPGGDVTLRFEISNPNDAETLESIAFDDDLDVTLSGLMAFEATANTCGGMALNLFPTGLFEYGGGSLLAGESCVVELTLSVPVDAALAVYPNTTSAPTGVVAGVLGLTGVPATDNLEIEPGPVFLSAVSVVTAGPNWAVVGKGEFTAGDSDSDVVVQNTVTGEVGIWKWTGTTFVEGVSVGTPSSADWVVKAVGQFTVGDTDLDLVLQDGVTGAVVIWKLTGTGLVEVVVVASAGPDWKVVGVGQLTGDAVPDLVLQNMVTGEVGIWEWDGSMFVGSLSVGNAGPDWVVRAIGAFTRGDVGLDLVLQNSVTGQVGIWKLTGTTLAEGFLVENAGPNWVVKGIGDFTADADLDLVVQNKMTGLAGIWKLAGATFVQGYFVANGGSDWMVRAVDEFTGDTFLDWVLQNMVTGEVGTWALTVVPMDP